MLKVLKNKAPWGIDKKSDSELRKFLQKLVL